MYYENYKKLRDEKGVKDADVAKATGIDQATFSHWKQNKYTPKDDKLTKIAGFFNLSLEAFKNETERAKPYGAFRKLLSALMYKK